MVVGIDGFTEFRRSLDDDLEVTAKDGEVIDLIGTVESLERRIEIAQGDAFTGDFVAVDFQLIARGVSGKSRVNRTDFRTLAGSGDDFCAVSDSSAVVWPPRSSSCMEKPDDVPYRQLAAG